MTPLIQWQQWVVFAVIISVFALFLKGRWPVELVALLGCAVLLLTGILSPSQLLGSFSNPAPVTIGALFILSASLDRTGIIATMGGWFNRKAKGSERRALVMIMLIGTPVSAFVNNTPIVVILLPVLLAFCRNSGVKPSRLLMPLSFATILGGTCSMAGTSTNLLVDGIARSSGIPPFHLFAIAPLGIMFVLVGSVYLWLVAPKLLPQRDTLSTLLDTTFDRKYLLLAMVPIGSRFINSSPLSIIEGKSQTMRILEIRRKGKVLKEALFEIVLEEGDQLLIRTGKSGVAQLRQFSGLRMGLDSTDDGDDLAAIEEQEAVILEGMIGPNSRLRGRTLAGISFRSNYSTIVLAVHREGRNIMKSLDQLRLQFGDTLLVEGARDGIDRLKAERDFIALSEPAVREYRLKKSKLALTGMGLFVLLAMFDFKWIGLNAENLSTTGAAFLAAVFVVATGCLTPRQAYESIDWRILLLIVGMLSIGSAMSATGAAHTLATAVGDIFASFGPWVLLAVVYLMTNIMTEMISNNAVAVVMTPIAIQIADAADVSPIPLIVAVMFGASASFSTPIGYQTNTYVFGAGGYLFKDFVKVGLPLNILLWITATALIPVFWPFH
ncbi:MAG: SLC13 family permease [Deltaproteobacteria bacterium]|nr:SLC13 family permease [Deltaproteobacteria bacterium]